MDFTRAAMTAQEVKELATYLDKVADAIPSGLSHLKDAVSFASIDLAIGGRGPNFSKAVSFALTIPRVTKIEDDRLTEWMLHDTKHLEYFPL